MTLESTFFNVRICIIVLLDYEGNSVVTQLQKMKTINDKIMLLAVV